MSSTHLPGGNQALLGCSATELEGWAVAEGQPAFRGRQLHEWLYAKGARSFEAITVLPKSWRLSLQQRGITIGRLLEVNRAVAVDDTTKLLLATVDGETIESVGIPTQQRLTVCLSSQVGCPMACRFCASGKGGLQRSLATHEIVDQVLSLREAMDRRPSHVVFMGMGEPLLNIEAVLAAIRCLNIDLGIAQRRITVSTVGVPHTLPQLAELAMKRLGRAQFTLAVSLHAPNQELRERLIPTACAYPFETLLQDCRHYLAVTGRRVTFEYILLGALNDQPQHAEELADRVRGFQSHVNLIAYNPIDDEGFQRPNPETIEAFRRVLEQCGVAVSLRASRGLDQNAACGQLRRQHAATG
ncbi:putative dual-specificity RNA methyltransferase RlmN [Prochlorococcus marinus str. MIT 1342]|uniref:23S rRNA (adenine(2503)-C(2))-methyltransferase RlmN n=1 Tax=Prochlorococcus TaxID=1218 RepID=UPI0007B36B7B|nr:23S rRNA (adenine(2503)-C(2))-methyltransferase RlmN [Prochlorococcus marinus]KZR81685.1 putative dual-specificity RNA methyltransferase RlmN [Prochlorococcus marinus str. MIT 1342]